MPASSISLQASDSSNKRRCVRYYKNTHQRSSFAFGNKCRQKKPRFRARASKGSMLEPESISKQICLILVCGKIRHDQHGAGQD